MKLRLNKGNEKSPYRVQGKKYSGRNDVPKQKGKSIVEALTILIVQCKRGLAGKTKEIIRLYHQQYTIDDQEHNAGCCLKPQRSGIRVGKLPESFGNEPGIPAIEQESCNGAGIKELRPLVDADQ